MDPIMDWRRCLGCAMGLVLLAPVAFAQPYDFSPVTAYIDANRDVFENEIVVLVERDGARLYKYNHGFDEDTKRGVASATKWMAASIVMRVGEEGWYDLDDRVGDYLEVMEQAGKGDFTIRHAFSMSSGLYDDSRYHTQPNLTLEQSVAEIAANVPIIFPPGTEVAYDGKQMQVVGLIAQQETGVDWRTLAQTRLFDPCGMTSTDYLRFGTNPAVAGGIQTTPVDYMRFLRMLMNNGQANGQQVLSPAILAEMFTNQTYGLPIRETPIPEESNWFAEGDGEFHYALGSWVMVEAPDGGPVRELTSPGAWGTHPWVDFDRDIYGIVFLDVPVSTDAAIEGCYHIMQLVRNAIDNVDRRTMRVGDFAADYYDPEFHSSANLMAFQDAGAGSVWLAPIEPTTGFFSSSVAARDILVNMHVSALIESNNGPEFGADANGWALFYPKPINGVHRLWRSTWDGSTVASTMLTGPDSHRANVLPSRTDNQPDTLLAFLKGTADVGGPLAWASELAPANEREFLTYIRGGTPMQWIPASRDMLISYLPDGATNRRLAIYQTPTATRTDVTDGSADMSFPTPFLAPELGNELLLAGVENGTTLVVLRQQPSGQWAPWSRLAVPAQSAYTRIASPEAFAFRGRSFVSLQIEADTNEAIQPAEIWLFGIDDDPARRITLRCDDARPGPIRRTDPEYYIGADDVFVFYSVIDDDASYQLWRCKSGLGAALDGHFLADSDGWVIY